jgi:hypothetical protein
VKGCAWRARAHMKVAAQLSPHTVNRHFDGQ